MYIDIIYFKKSINFNTLKGQKSLVEYQLRMPMHYAKNIAWNVVPVFAWCSLFFMEYELCHQKSIVYLFGTLVKANISAWHTG